MVSRKISLFGKMQRGRSPSFELFQLDMYGLYIWGVGYIAMQAQERT